MNRLNIKNLPWMMMWMISMVHADLCFNDCTTTLAPIFTAGQGYQCIRATITVHNKDDGVVTYSQGHLFFARYYDALRNYDSATEFPAVKSSDTTCSSGSKQPFDASKVTYLAPSQASVLVSRSGNVTFNGDQFQLQCNNGFFVGNSGSKLYTFHFFVMPIEQACGQDPLPVGGSCSDNSITVSQQQVTSYKDGTDTVKQFQGTITNSATQNAVMVELNAPSTFNPDNIWGLTRKSGTTNTWVLSNGASVVAGATYNFGYIIRNVDGPASLTVNSVAFS